MFYKKLLQNYSTIPLRVLLNYELVDRRRKNKSYSLRAFALSLGVPASTLSRFLKGHRVPSTKFVAVVCKKLGISEARVTLPNPPSKSKAQLFQYLDPKKYGDIEHSDFALTEILKILPGPVNPEQIADALEVSGDELIKIRDRLEHYGLISVEGDFWTPTEPHTSFLTLENTEKEQEQLMQLSVQSIRRGPSLGKRSHSGLLIAINTSRWLEAVEKIDEFRRSMQELLTNEASGGLDQVYNFTISLHPVSKKVKGSRTRCPLIK